MTLQRDQVPPILTSGASQGTLGWEWDLGISTSSIPNSAWGLLLEEKGETTPKDECGCFLLKWGGTKPVDIWDECH